MKNIAISIRKFNAPSVLLILLSLILVAGSVKAQTGDLDIITGRIIKNILHNPVHDGQVTEILDQLSEKGTWPDIDYVDTTRTGFQHAQHLNRMALMAKAYRLQESDYYQHSNILISISMALDYWLRNDFICQNWWWNQIGTPRYLVTVLLLVGDELSKERVVKTVEIIDRAHLNASGARPSGDRIKIAGILAKKLLVTEDKDQFDQVIEVIEREIKFSDGRGMQVDYSFHHRLDRVNNTLSYGLGYAQAFAEWAAYVAGTQYEFRQPSIHQLVDYYLDGICKMMVFGKYPDPGVKNRSVSREGALHAYGVETIDQLMKATNYREEELRTIRAARLNGGKKHREYNKFFWQTEYMSHQRPGYFTSARMYSIRNQNMEYPYNSEGLKNHYLGDGANFISRTGQEYYDIFPVLDWRRIPGTTVVQKPEMPSEKEIREKGITKYVGGVSDGLSGASAFDYVKKRDSLQARKSWFFFDDVLVCLGAGITASSVFPVNTTINQCLLNGPVKFSTEDDANAITSNEQREMRAIRWVWHDSIGYLFPEPAQIHLSNRSQSGSWFDINQQSDSPRDQIKENIFKLWLNHGTRPVDKSYSYMVIPAVSSADLNNRDYNKFVRILSNNPKLQAVQHRVQGMIQGVFYESGTLRVSPDLIIDMEDPGLILVSYRNGEVLSIAVSDPTRDLEELHFSISKNIQIESDRAESQWNASSGRTQFKVKLPRGAFAGSSVILLPG